MSADAVDRDVDEAIHTLAKLDAVWNELYCEQFDDWRPEQPAVMSPTPGDRLLHTGTPGELQRYVLAVQRAVRHAWVAVGGRWPQPPRAAADRTFPPDVMRRITCQLADALQRAAPDDSSARQAAAIIQGGWNALPAGLRGEAKGGARRCTIASCTEPAEPGRRKCGRHKYAARQPTTTA